MEKRAEPVDIRTASNLCYLVHFGAEERLALKLDVCDVACLRALDVHLSTELDPWNGQDAPSKGRRKCGDVLFVQIQQVDGALANVVDSDLK